MRASVARFLATTQGLALRVAAGLSLVVAGSLLGGAWWVVAAIGVLLVATGRRENPHSCRCRG
ncbi:MAG: hypothetical protein ACLPUG_11260 [Acidimicrobiales bacterium]